MRKHLGKRECEKWVRALDELGTGEKWTVEETTEIADKLNIDFSKINKYEFYALMNEFYILFYGSSRLLNHENDIEFTASLVLDFFLNEYMGFRSCRDYYFSYAAS